MCSSAATRVREPILSGNTHNQDIYLAMVSLASQLPSDILRLIFDTLGQPAVIACAAVCREWRTTAMLDRSYYRALTLLFPTDQKPPVANQTHDNSLEILRCAARDAEQLQYGISLTIHVRVSFEALCARDPENALTLAIEIYKTGPIQVEQELVPVLRSAIPHLVRLDLQVEETFLRRLLPALTAPAPQLCVLKVHVWVEEHGSWYDTIPRDLFSGHAPLLTEVDLSCLQLHAPPPCFEHVRRLHWDSHLAGGQLSEIRVCFPRIERLALHYLCRTPGDPVSKQETAFFERLRSLFIGRHVNGSALTPFLASIFRIPDVELCAATNIDSLAGVLGIPGPDEMVLSEHVAQDLPGEHFSHLRVHLRAASATRLLNSCVDYDMTLRTLRLSSVALSLTNVTVDDRHVRGLMTACPSMPLLEHLIVMLIGWSAAAPKEPNTETHCGCVVHPFFALDTRPPDEALAADYPRLHTLELRATHAGTTVRADVLPALVRCLGQLHLVLSNGVSLDPGAAETTFATILRGYPRDSVLSADTARVAALLETAARHPERIHSSHCPQFRRKKG